MVTKVVPPVSGRLRYLSTRLIYKYSILDANNGNLNQSGTQLIYMQLVEQGLPDYLMCGADYGDDDDDDK